MTEAETLALLATYDDLAVDIVSDASPNDDVELSYSNRELTENICQALDVEAFDLLGKFDFDAVYASKEVDIILAHAFISFLRWRLFTAASLNGIGVESFNVKSAAYSEYWYVNLIHRWNELTGGTPIKSWKN